MYLPYLRGRQNELLCLRELVDNNLLSSHIVPIIEPVRYSSTLFSTIKKFIAANKDIIIIRNPSVGNYDSDIAGMNDKINSQESETKKKQMQKEFEENQKLLNDPHVINGYLCNKIVVKKCLNKTIPVENIALINTDLSNLDFYEENGDLSNAKYTVIPKDEDFHDVVQDNVIVLEDSFKKAKRNQDYLDRVDEMFSKTHITYSKHGYKGFSDYSIVGEAYDESGFAPVAVAIHVLYFDEKKYLRVHHFVSDTNSRKYDTPGKFGEAMKNLIEWERFDSIPRTRGLTRLLECYNKGKFPGLGLSKKYCIMHHLELIGKYFGDVE